MSVQEAFEQATNLMSTSTSRFSNEEKLRSYGLFKQAKFGDCTDPTPSKFNQTAYWKHYAWTEYKGRTTEEAMADYVRFVADLDNETGKEVHKLLPMLD